MAQRKQILINDVLLHILEYLDSNTLHTCLFINRSLYNLVVPLVWRSPYFRNFEAARTLKRSLEDHPKNAIFIRELCFNTIGAYSYSENALLMSLINACHRLIKLDLSYLGNVTDSVLEIFAQQCPELRIIYLRDCRNLTDKTIKALALGSNRLREVNLERCFRMTSRVITDLAKRQQHIENLDLTFCPWVTDDLAYPMTAFHSLNALNLSACSRVTSQFLIILAPYVPYLKELHLGGLKNVSDEAIIKVATHCFELETLVMCGCNIHDVSLYCIAENLRKLKKVDVSFCPRITQIGLEFLSCMNLQSLRSSDLDLNYNFLGSVRNELPRLFGDVSNNVTAY
ncbi:hypothetical protein G9A89_016757 [Geosiphon pyriformis]|nr:hypothetical protein G9A89_016757 [Geosiphon pyriformis]